MLLEGKTAIVTGASGGIGKAIAIALAKEGASVAVHFHGNEEKALLVKKEIEEAGGKAEVFRANVADFEECNALVKAAAKTFGSIDILVNNAGIIKRIPMCEMTAAEFRQVIDVDLNAPFIVSKAVIPSMIKKGHGKIINICSMMSELGRETVSAYAAAKGGLKMLTTASTTSSVMVSDLDTLQLLRLHLFVRSSQTVPDIHLTSLS